MKQRTITGAILFIVLAPILFLGGYFMLGLVAILSYIAGWELIKMFSKKNPRMMHYRFLIPIYSVLLVIINYLVIKQNMDYKDLLFFLLIEIIFILIIVLRDNKLKMSNAAGFIFIIIYGGLFFSTATSIRYVTNIDSVTSKYIGLWLIVYILATTMFTDMGAYTVGTICGKHKLCPSISPKKTVEGAIGGSIIGAIVGTVILVLVENHYNISMLNINNEIINILLIFVVSLFITILGQIGDLIASKLKREYDIKDYSNIFPGHGGVLDRFDSFIITGTFFYLVCLYIGII